jgi:hypothetical protein
MVIPKIIHRVVACADGGGRRESPVLSRDADRYWAMMEELHPGWEFLT